MSIRSSSGPEILDTYRCICIGEHLQSRVGSLKIHKDRGSLPFCHVTLSTTKPADRAYPAELKTIGDHLRKRRLDLGLLQREVARQIGVTKCTVQYWETNRVAPALRFRPRITSFLGYDACTQRTTESVTEQLRSYRERFGLSRKKLAALLGIDPSNITGWETGRHRPTKKSLELIAMFLMSMIR
jgi:transcriptional regulator with XRE-family HTH domain